MNQYQKNRIFSQGYACAIACIVKGHGHGAETWEALSANGLDTREKAACMGVQEYDLDILFPKNKVKASK